MASKNRDLSPIEQKAVLSVSQWLGGEHAYQFSKNKITHQADPWRSYAYILTSEIPNKWSRYQLFREYAAIDKQVSPKWPVGDKMLMQLGQNILKCAGAARGAYVWANVMGGMKPAEASNETWDDLRQLKTELLTGERPLPKTYLLGDTIEDAVKTYEKDEQAYGRDPATTFRAITCLAIQGVVEFQKKHESLVLPMPGVASGQLRVWDYDPALIEPLVQ